MQVHILVDIQCLQYLLSFLEKVLSPCLPVIYVYIRVCHQPQGLGLLLVINIECSQLLHEVEIDSEE